MKKILIYLALTIGVLIALARTTIWIYHTNRNLENPNSIGLINNSNLPTNDFKVIWGAYDEEPLTIFEQGNDTKVIFKEYGSNNFELFYKDSLLAEFWQYKYNNWHGHHYTFLIQQLNDSLNIELFIEGHDTTRFGRTK